MNRSELTRQQLDTGTVLYLESLATQMREVGFRCELPENVRGLPFYTEVMRLYEYAIEGVRVPNDPDDGGAGDLMDLMIFLDGLFEAGHSAELGRYGNPHPPSAALQLGRIAFARHNLDTGEDLLSIAEVALLAGMDEKSVRNATNEKAADRLHVVKTGKGVDVPNEEARRWLQGRKGFVPTGGPSSAAVPLTLSPGVANLLRAQAASQRVDVETFIRQSFGGKP